MFLGGKFGNFLNVVLGTFLDAFEMRGVADDILNFTGLGQFVSLPDPIDMQSPAEQIYDLPSDYNPENPAVPLQNGGVASMRGTPNMLNNNMVIKSQEQFAEKIAEAVTPVVIPMNGGSGGGGVVSAPSPGTPVPSLPSGDSSIVAMEYKYRITMGASV